MKGVAAPRDIAPAARYPAAMLSAMLRRWVPLGFLLCATVSSRAGLAPENIAVVVNGDSWASLTVAQEYARLRGIPSSNFVVLQHLSGIEFTDVDHFRSEILVPVFETLAQRGLSAHIDCIAYSVDLPYAVDVGSDMAGKHFGQVITGTASINGLTYLHELVDQKDTDYLRLDINRYARRLLPLPSGSSLTADERTAYAKAMELYTAKKYFEAAEALQKLVSVPRSDAGVAYDLACCLSLAGKPDDAVAALRKAVAAGWRSYGMATSDPDLAPLVSRDDFQQIIRTIRSAPLSIQPGVGFRSSFGWDESGRAVTSGPHYMLSTMLGATCGRGNSVAEVLDCLRRAAEADFTSPRGTIYFMKNGDVRSTTREWGFIPTVEALGHAGVEGIVEPGVLPADHADVAGAMIGSAGFDWAASHSTILPGAICEHLTSFGGIIAERADQTPCTDLIRAGAAGSSGTVTEPYALQQKFPTPFMHLQYARGWTLAEAFYLSLSGPYQLLIIGDPMCRPWAKALRISVPGLAPNARIKGIVTLKPTASRPGDVNRYELYVDGRFASEGKALKIDSTALADGYHALSVVAVENDAPQSKTHIVVPITVANRGRAVVANVPGSIGAAFGGKVSISLSCAGASSIDVMHFGRSIAHISGAKGSVSLDAAQLGIGRAVLMPVAHVGAQNVCGSPIVVLVDQPGAIEPSAEAGATLEPGLVLTVAGGSQSVVKDTFDGAWLSKLVGGTNQSFVLTGDYEAPKADLYQLQIKTNTQATVEFGGQKVATIADERWHLVPLRLKPGTYALAIHGIAPANATLDVRLGCAGAAHLSERQFKHVRG